MLKDSFLFIFELLKIVVISLVIIIPVRYFLIQPFYVKGASMEPNFHDHEYLIIDEISYRFNERQRGDVIVFRYPKNPQEYFIKRIIGLPGEEIEVKDGDVVIYNDENPDGFVLAEDYLEEGVKTLNIGNRVNKVILGKNEYFVLGDNRNQSKDSRTFGPVNENYITGKVLFRGWPLNKIQIFDTPIYPELDIVN